MPLPLKLLESLGEMPSAGNTLDAKIGARMPEEAYLEHLPQVMAA
jgi:hypothetical protein